MGANDVYVLSSSDKIGEEKSQQKRVPCEKPPFTLATLKKAIPAHCFQRSLLRSFSYLFCNLAAFCTLFYLAKTYIPMLPSPFNYVAWPLYWIIQGAFMTGLWVLCHELGHNAFSEYVWVDNILGFIIHSALMTPFFSWKYSHRRHHSNTGSVTYDEVYPPPLKDSIPWYAKYMDNPVCTVIGLVFLLFTAFPLYLLVNAYSRKYDRFANHFDPYSPIFNDSERLQVVISNAGILTALYVFYSVSMAHGFAWFSCIYLAPLFFMFALVLTVTLLQHTNPTLPHYDDSEWDWLRGALSTLDLDFGPLLNTILHEANSTHICHHLFPKIPHYHATEATQAMKPILGDYYRIDSTPIHKMLYTTAKECIYAEPDQDSKNKGVYWYRCWC
ncbi:hypothetical protein Tsubulata_024539 [Turnera subulata]|uniref:Fatty acid desaturase domain-containing protein n=1 Tax=Turnera subulata TaxID=218843 RepID=A0A9Q0JCD0_9ROSI|nr:hypothetical protein Tsubulata_024539 [Turnera subulata]